jgi:hypothetical protein
MFFSPAENKEERKKGKRRRHLPHLPSVNRKEGRKKTGRQFFRPSELREEHLVKG